MSSVEAQAQEILDSLPPRFRAEAESVRQMGERERWLSGDQCVDLVDELTPRYSKAAVRLALALLYHCTDGTIRDREYVCRRIPASMRAAYPSVSFHYWRACAQSGNPVELANQIVAYLEAYGRLPSVNSVYGWLHEDGNGLPVWMLRLNALFDRIEKIQNDPLLPGEVGAALSSAVIQLEAALVLLVEDAEQSNPRLALSVLSVPCDTPPLQQIQRH